MICIAFLPILAVVLALALGFTGALITCAIRTGEDRRA